MVAEGNRVSKRWTLRGTQTGALLGIPPTNKQVALQVISIYDIEGGLVKEIWWVTPAVVHPTPGKTDTVGGPE
jgi:predicted ester cyclase